MQTRNLWEGYTHAHYAQTQNEGMETGNEHSASGGLSGVPYVDVSASQPAIGSRVRFSQGGVVATVISNSSVCTGHDHGLREVGVL